MGPDGALLPPTAPMTAEQALRRQLFEGLNLSPELHGLIQDQADAERQLRGQGRVGGSRNATLEQHRLELTQVQGLIRNEIDTMRDAGGNFLSLNDRLDIMTRIDNMSGELQAMRAPQDPNRFATWVADHPGWATALTVVASVGAGLLFTPAVAVLVAGKAAATAGLLTWGRQHMVRTAGYTSENVRNELMGTAATPGGPRSGGRFGANNDQSRLAQVDITAAEAAGNFAEANRRYMNTANNIGARVLTSAENSRRTTRRSIVRPTAVATALGLATPLAVYGVADALGANVNWWPFEAWNGDGAGEAANAAPTQIHLSPEQLQGMNDAMRQQVEQAIISGNTASLDGIPGLPDFAQMHANTEALASSYDNGEVFWANVQSGGDGFGSGTELGNGQTQENILRAMSELRNAGYPVEGIGDLKWDGNEWVTTGDLWRFEASGGFEVDVPGDTPGNTKDYFFPSGPMDNSHLAAFTEAIIQPDATIVSAEQIATGVPDITEANLNGFLNAEVTEIQNHVNADIAAAGGTVTDAQGAQILRDAIRVEIADNGRLYAALPDAQLTEYLTTRIDAQLDGSLNSPQWVNPEAIRTEVERVLAGLK